MDKTATFMAIFTLKMGPPKTIGFRRKTSFRLPPFEYTAFLKELERLQSCQTSLLQHHQKAWARPYTYRRASNSQELQHYRNAGKCHREAIPVVGRQLK